MDKHDVHDRLKKLIEAHGSKFEVDLEMLRYFRTTWNTDDDRDFEEWAKDPEGENEEE